MYLCCKYNKIYSTMYTKNAFLEREIQYEKLEKIGIDRKSFLSMPKELLEPLLSGKMSPLIKATFKAENGKTVSLPLKLQFVRDKSGNVRIMTFPVRKEIPMKDIKFNDIELKRLKEGEVIKKDMIENGSRKQQFIQLDPETKSLMIRSVAAIRFRDKILDLERINDIQLGRNQKQAAIEGKPIELTIGDRTVTVGVDLREPQGFKIVQGDMNEWKRQQSIKYDLEHEGFMGYVQTEQNRWEYQRVVDRLSHKSDINLSQKQETKQSSGIRL